MLFRIINIETDLPQKDVITKIQENIGREIVNPLGGYLGHQKIIGRVYDDYIILRVNMKHMDSLQPALYAFVTHKGKGTKIKGLITVDPVTLMLYAVIVYLFIVPVFNSSRDLFIIILSVVSFLLIATSIYSVRKHPIILTSFIKDIVSNNR